LRAHGVGLQLGLHVVTLVSVDEQANTPAQPQQHVIDLGKKNEQVQAYVRELVRAYGLEEKQPKRLSSPLIESTRDNMKKLIGELAFAWQVMGQMHAKVSELSGLVQHLQQELQRVAPQGIVVVPGNANPRAFVERVDQKTRR
jgi:hypothetical protein